MSSFSPKRIARRYMSRNLYSRLAKVYNPILGFAASIIYMPLSLVPAGLLVRVKERLRIKEKLDYSRDNVFLNVESLFEHKVRLNSCSKEPETVEWIEKFVAPGDVVYDVGANVGAYSLIIDRHTRGTAKVVAFEPSFSNFAQLCNNIKLNSCGRSIVPLYVALSNTTGVFEFNYTSTLPGHALHALGKSLNQKGDAFSPEFSLQMLSYRMDDLVEIFRLPKPNHIKLDVDGIEHDILLGACGCLSAPSMKSICVEIEPTMESAQRILGLLARCGFRKWCERSHGTGSDTTNCIFVRDGFAPRV